MENKKMNVGLYVNSNVTKNIDFSTALTIGNPGVGGTEYMTVSLAMLLSQKDFEVYICSKEPIIGIPSNIHRIECDKNTDAVRKFDDLVGGKFIYAPTCMDDMQYGELKQTKIITWAHLDYLEYRFCKYLGNCDDVESNVFLTKAQYNRYYLYPKLLKKSTIIGHFVVPIPEDKIDPNHVNTHNVTYIGYLGPSKGFDALADVWPKVIKKVPDAHLYVCGSGTLYDKNQKLGERGICEASYEDRIFKPLEENGVVDTVTFLGSINRTQMLDIFAKTKVGVVNPSMHSLPETFCLSALDFVAYGIPVIGANKEGLKNTIRYSFGYRVNNKKQLLERLTYVLSNINKSLPINMDYYTSHLYNTAIFVRSFENVMVANTRFKDHFLFLHFLFRLICFGISRICRM